MKKNLCQEFPLRLFRFSQLRHLWFKSLISKCEMSKVRQTILKVNHSKFVKYKWHYKNFVPNSLDCISFPLIWVNEKLAFWGKEEEEELVLFFFDNKRN